MLELPKNYFRCIVVDPPWAFKSYTKLTEENSYTRRDADKHYSVMDIYEIEGLPMRDHADKNCHLFMWTTGPFMKQAIDVLLCWGFEFSTVAFTWVKLKRSTPPARILFNEEDLHVGLGHTTRKNAEFVLLGRRGNPHRNAKDVRELIISPVREHSRKPDEFYSRVERYCDGPRLDMFGRQSRDGWTVWGDQSTMFDKSPTG